MISAERKSYWVGVDIAKDTFDVSVAYTGSQPLQWRELPVHHIDHAPGSREGIKALLTWLGRVASEGTCMGICAESTGSHSWRFARAVARTHLPHVSIINPKRSKDFAGTVGVRTRNDRISSAIVAMYGLLYQPAPTPLPTKAEQTLRELNRMRDALVMECTRWKNRFQECLSTQGAENAQLMIERLTEEKTRIEEQIDCIVTEDALLRDQACRLQTIHGIGRVIARTICAELGLLRHYSRSNVVGAVGVYPVVCESGSSVKSVPHMAKGGGGRVRRVLYMGALSVFCNPGPYEAFTVRLQRAGKTKMIIIGALMRKILTVARAVMVDDGKYDERLIGSGFVPRKAEPRMTMKV